MNTHKKRTVRLLLCLTLMLAIASVFAGTCFAEGDVLTLNASGVLNRALSVDPTGKTEGFSAVLYNNPNGLPTSEANAIAETGEGFIWIGSYAGLMRHDGTSFERLDSATGISSVILPVLPSFRSFKNSLAKRSSSILPPLMMQPLFLAMARKIS